MLRRARYVTVATSPCISGVNLHESQRKLTRGFPSGEASDREDDVPSDRERAEEAPIGQGPNGRERVTNLMNDERIPGQLIEIRDCVTRCIAIEFAPTVETPWLPGLEDLLMTASAPHP
jgi:hypothetical protein